MPKLHKSNERDKWMLALGGGLVLSGFIPTPADAWNFHQQRKLRQKLILGEMTPKEYWQKVAFNHYGYTTAYWLSVVGVSFTLGKNFEQRRNIFIAMAVGGAVIGVLTKNIREDEKFFADHKIVAVKRPAPKVVSEDEQND